MRFFRGLNVPPDSKALASIEPVGQPEDPDVLALREQDETTRPAFVAIIEKLQKTPFDFEVILRCLEDKKDRDGNTHFWQLRTKDKKAYVTSNSGRATIGIQAEDDPATLDCINNDDPDIIKILNKIIEHNINIIQRKNDADNTRNAIEIIGAFSPPAPRITRETDFRTQILAMVEEEPTVTDSLSAMQFGDGLSRVVN